MRKTLSILGVTGSVGSAAADVIASAPEKFNVKLVTAGSNATALALAAIRLKACRAVIADDAQYETLKNHLAGTNIEVAAGQAALENAAGESVDLTLTAIVGMAGLRPTLRAVQNSKAVAIANKESLVAAGGLIMDEAKRRGTVILPVDSEHNAIFQVFDFERPEGIEKIILTASGGPFRTWSREQMEAASVDEALNHPTWPMGRKISIDSATLMNKALEVIEAHVLFGQPPEKIDVIVHPQSIIHSMVEYADGSILAQMGASDMRTPIAHVLAWPERMKTPGKRLNVQTLANLTFEPVDTHRFPALALARAALQSGPDATVALNAANEIGVEAFLVGRIGFNGISHGLCRIMDEVPRTDVHTLDAIEAHDRHTRDKARIVFDTLVH